MDASPDHEGRRPGGLQEDLSDEQRGDGTLGEEEAELFSLRAEQGLQGSWSPCCVRGALGVWSSMGVTAARTPGLVEKRCEKANSRSLAQ